MRRSIALGPAPVVASVRRLLRRGAVVHQGQRRRRGHADDAGHRRVGSASDAGRRRVRPGVSGHRSESAWARRRCRSSGSAVRRNIPGSARCEIRGIRSTLRARRHRARRRSWQPVWCPSHTPTTAAGPSEFPLLAMVVGSSRHEDGFHLTKKRPRCRCTWSPTGWVTRRCAIRQRSCAKRSACIAIPSCVRSAT